LCVASLSHLSSTLSGDTVAHMFFTLSSFFFIFVLYEDLLVSCIVAPPPPPSLLERNSSLYSDSDPALVAVMYLLYSVSHQDENRPLIRLSG
jgi:hypothetical protein